MFGVADIPRQDGPIHLRIHLRPDDLFPRLEVVDDHGQAVARPRSRTGWRGDKIVTAHLGELPSGQLEDFFDCDVEYLPDTRFADFEHAPLVRRLRKDDYIEWTELRNGKLRAHRGTIERISHRGEHNDLDAMTSWISVSSSSLSVTRPKCGGFGLITGMSARPQAADVTPRFQVTQQVRVRARPDDVGLIWKVHDVGDEPTYDVFFDAQRTTTFAEHALLPFAVDNADASSPIDALRLWQLADAPEFRRFLTLERLTYPLAGTVYSYLASKTELLPYQFKPILKLLDNPYGRLLIADEVGLGKTIEAGIILVELNARQPLNRVLVVCPSALTEKWRRELLNRFDLEFEVVRGAQLGDFVRRATERPGRPHHAISSLETLRGTAALELLEESRVDFDVVIVDEAHHMRNSWTRSNALGDHLGSVADTMVFLTATPLNLGRLDFFELLHLLVPEEFEDFSSFETQIAPNAHLNEALRAIRATPSDPRRALAELSKIPQLVSRRVGDDPRFADALARVREAAGDDGTIEPAVSVVVQKHLTELNTLSHVFARTRKREVQQLFPLRRASPVMVQFSEAEQQFYEAVSAWVRLANERYGVGVGIFVLMNYQRQLASCMPAMADKLRSTVLSGTMTYTAA